MTSYLKLVFIMGTIALISVLFFFPRGNKEIPKEALSLSQEERITIATSTVIEQTEEKKPVIKKAPISILAPRVEFPPIFIPSPKVELEPPPSATTTTSLPESPISLPPLDEAAILRAVVKIECPTDDGLGKYIGSGFVLKGGIAVTAAHVVKDSGSDTCSIIFPRERRPVHYLKGKIENLEKVKIRHDEEGIDVAALKLPSLDFYPEARVIFEEYPAIPYPVCENPVMLGDTLFHFGYPSNYLDQNYLSRLEGKAIVYADIDGIKEQLSQDQTYTFKTPILSYTSDQTKMHHYMISRVASFYGDSGGLAFNATKQCILGPHRGGTIGKTSGENYSIFMLLGWENTRELITF